MLRDFTTHTGVKVRYYIIRGCSRETIEITPSNLLSHIDKCIEKGFIPKVNTFISGNSTKWYEAEVVIVGNKVSFDYFTDTLEGKESANRLIEIDKFGHETYFEAICFAIEISYKLAYKVLNYTVN